MRAECDSSLARFHPTGAGRLYVGTIRLDLPWQGNEARQSDEEAGRHRPLMRPEFPVFSGDPRVPEWPIDISVSSRYVDSLE
jgi:hypothetical protein